MDVFVGGSALCVGCEFTRESLLYYKDNPYMIAPDFLGLFLGFLRRFNNFNDTFFVYLDVVGKTDSRHWIINFHNNSVAEVEISIVSRGEQQFYVLVINKLTKLIEFKDGNVHAEDKEIIAREIVHVLDPDATLDRLKCSPVTRSNTRTKAGNWAFTVNRKPNAVRGWSKDKFPDYAGATFLAFEVLKAIDIECEREIPTICANLDARLWLVCRVLCQLLDDLNPKEHPCLSDENCRWKLECMKCDLKKWADGDEAELTTDGWPMTDVCCAVCLVDIRYNSSCYYVHHLCCNKQMHLSCFANMMGKSTMKEEKCVYCNVNQTKLPILTGGLYVALWSFNQNKNSQSAMEQDGWRKAEMKYLLRVYPELIGESDSEENEEGVNEPSMDRELDTIVELNVAEESADVLPYVAAEVTLEREVVLTVEVGSEVEQPVPQLSVGRRRALPIQARVSSTLAVVSPTGGGLSNTVAVVSPTGGVNHVVVDGIEDAVQDHHDRRRSIRMELSWIPKEGYLPKVALLSALGNLHVGSVGGNEPSYLWFGCQVFAFEPKTVQSEAKKLTPPVEMDLMSTTDLQLLLSTWFVPVRPKVPFQCTKCNRYYWNVTEYDQHLEIYNAHGECKPYHKNCLILRDRPSAFFLHTKMVLAMHEGPKPDEPFDILDAERRPQYLQNKVSTNAMDTGKEVTSAVKNFVIVMEFYLDAREAFLSHLSWQGGSFWSKPEIWKEESKGGSMKEDLYQRADLDVLRFSLYPECVLFQFMAPINHLEPVYKKAFYSKRTSELEKHKKRKLLDVRCFLLEE